MKTLKDKNNRRQKLKQTNKTRVIVMNTPTMEGKA